MTRPRRHLAHATCWAALLLAGGGCAWLFEPGPRADFLPELETRVLEAVNRIRIERDLQHLAPARDAARAARRHTADLIRRDTLSHLGPGGADVDRRLEAQGVEWLYAGENIARNRGFGDPVAEAVRGWMASPVHRENMLQPQYRETGIAVARSPETGYVYITQVFLKRMP